MLTCYRYIELNAVRAKRVEKPDEYRWSSYRANAYGVNNPTITPLRSCMALRKGRKQRAKYYRESFKEVLDGELINEIRASVQTGTPLGNERFKAEIEKLLGVKVGQARRGRPSKGGEEIEGQ